MRRALVFSACLIIALFPLTACSGLPGSEAEVDCIHYAVDADEVEPLPEDIQGVAVTHAVRAQIYACVDYEWQPIGGLARAYVNGEAVQPNVVSGVVISGVDTPWPYDREAVYTPFQLPLYIEPGISVTVTATFHTFVDAGEMIACWFVNPQGQELVGTRGQGVQKIVGGGVATANCIAAITG